ncbi:MAG: ferredoxin [Spirochaetales bacterium]|uniref:Ferredoxin n=1 Tax=Candidatus Thalassospirochaeta sargassi TaxID=3119039 RepID=A0AAJ1IBV4_9SPIO|nr:ferredoxin [Spirochaetales bacterium]
MKVKLDKNLCVGCGLCEENLPEVFRTGDYTAELKKDELPDDMKTKIEEIIEDCPADAISISETSAES